MNRINKVILIICLSLLYSPLLIAISHSAGTSPVNLNHWAYDIVERFAAEGYLNGFALNTKPYTRSDFVDIIIAMDSAVEEDNKGLNPLDLRLLDKLKSEFEFDLNDSGEWPDLPKSQSHLLSWYGDDYRWVLDPVLKGGVFETYTKNPDESWFTNTSATGIITYGYFRNDIDFYLYFRDTRFGRKNDFTSVDEISIENEAITSVTMEGNTASFDRAYACLSAKLKWFNAGIGRYKIDWGPSENGGLLFSAYALPFDRIILQYPGKRVRGTFIAGNLATELIDSAQSYQTPAKYRKNYKEKHIASHRLEVLPFGNLTIGLSESVIYGERGFDLGYLIPDMVFWSEQHYLGDRDNLLMSFDITYYPFRRYRFYGSLLVDDLSIGKLGDDFWGNKWAIQVGAENIDPLGIEGLSIRSEYVRIEPYVYTHFYAINSYTNHDQFLGYPLQPNSDRLSLTADYWFSPYIRFDLEYRWIRHGANPSGQNVGGDILFGHREVDPLTKDFLAGVEDNSWDIALGGGYEFFTEAFLKAKMEFKRNVYDGGKSDLWRIMAWVSYRYY